MAHFSKGTFIYLKLSISESKNPIYLMCEGVQSAGQYFCKNNSLRFQLWGFSIGFGRLPGTPDDKVPGLLAHTFTCQCYAASRRKNQSAAAAAAAACQSLTKHKH